MSATLTDQAATALVEGFFERQLRELVNRVNQELTRELENVTLPTPIIVKNELWVATGLWKPVLVHPHSGDQVQAVLHLVWKSLGGKYSCHPCEGFKPNDFSSKFFLPVSRQFNFDARIDPLSTDRESGVKDLYEQTQLKALEQVENQVKHHPFVTIELVAI